MILYHGSNVIVENPRITVPNRYLDFGPGFYTTSNIDQAMNFAKKVAARNQSGEALVSVYEFDDTKLKALQVQGFDSADEAWLDFVSDNRNGVEQSVKYDLIYGPVADDDIFKTFILYSTGVLSKEQTLEALKIKQLYNQYVFASEKSIKLLQFVKAIKGESKHE